ncbi:MAG: WYL domain-containing protein [Bacteroidales bacterium]|nr:WYL domain-containing protein [Bacteroidales bacterium]MCM1416692.1 WYL domain-containing protein [bacterium]MCM1423999.1 WYL domain-containing protein [bacterium]
MAKSGNQKLKLLYLLKILTEQSDEEHCLSAQALIEALKAYGISAERKSVYDDIAQLTDFGYDIVLVKAKSGGGYYLAGRDFELPELKLLVETVQASRFLTLNKSRELISKIEKLASKAQAGQLQRQVYVANRIKTANESIYYVVDDIHRAIQNNRQISFQYLEWNLNRELVPRKDGRQYIVSPWALTCKDENYYLIAHDSEEDKIKHFRVDKMAKIEVMEEKREGAALFERFDIADYANKTFGMYGGREETVTLLFENSLIGVVMDRFGKEAPIRKRDEEHFSVRVRVAVSGQFFGWLTGLGGGARIFAPEDVRAEYLAHLKETLAGYGGDSDCQ